MNKVTLAIAGVSIAPCGPHSCKQAQLLHSGAQNCVYDNAGSFSGITPHNKAPKYCCSPGINGGVLKTANELRSLGSHVKRVGTCNCAYKHTMICNWTQLLQWHALSHHARLPTQHPTSSSSRCFSKACILFSMIQSTTPQSRSKDLKPSANRRA